MAMNYFNGFTSLDEAKKEYRRLSKEMHPDLGGDAEQFKAMQAEYEKFVSTFMYRAWTKAESENKTGDNTFTAFEDILKKIIDFDMTIEIIGFWIYAKNSFMYKDELKALGFWFSGKHKAWIFSGSKKKSRATRLTEDQIKNIHGCKSVKQKSVQKRISA